MGLLSVLCVWPYVSAVTIAMWRLHSCRLAVLEQVKDKFSYLELYITLTTLKLMNMLQVENW